ncbi:MAG: DNA cytosine methyltransferase [Muribaculaceae bacterium]|nr:DNA cytosine methyltransferase [Muribaculaceae bacterium]
MRAGTVPAAVYENHSQDTRYTELENAAHTVSATYGTGGNNQPFVVETPQVYGICSKGSNAMKSDNPRSGFYSAETSRTLDGNGGNPSCNQGGIAVVETAKTFDVRFTSNGTKNARQNCYETETARTIDTGGNSPDSNQGGVAVVSVQGSMIGRKDKNGPQGSGVNENISFTLNAADRHAVAFSQDAYDKYAESKKCGSLRASGGTYGGGSETLVYSTSKASYHTAAEENLANTLVATDCKDPPVINDFAEHRYIVRRLTPTECARLQGFPDWWCGSLGTENPTDEDISFWRDVFETHRKITGTSSKPKSDKQIVKWLKNPHSDSAEYKMWGNGVALPCVVFVLSGIVYCSQFSRI